MHKCGRYVSGSVWLSIAYGTELFTVKGVVKGVGYPLGCIADGEAVGLQQR